MALGTDWAFTAEDDPNYTIAFNVTLILALMNFIYQFMAFPAIKQNYEEKRIDRQIQKRIKQDERVR